MKNLETSQDFKRVRVWAKKRGIITKGNQETQIIKLIEEYGELCGGILKKDHELTVDSIGDMIVVLINLNKICGFDLEHGLKDYKINTLTDRECLKEIYVKIGMMFESPQKTIAIINQSGHIISLLDTICDNNGLDISTCLAIAYSEIKNRTGKNVNGNFIKD